VNYEKNKKGSFYETPCNCTTGQWPLLFMYAAVHLVVEILRSRQ